MLITQRFGGLGGLAFRSRRFCASGGFVPAHLTTFNLSKAAIGIE